MGAHLALALHTTTTGWMDATITVLRKHATLRTLCSMVFYSSCCSAVHSAANARDGIFYIQLEHRNPVYNCIKARLSYY